MSNKYYVLLRTSFVLVVSLFAFLFSFVTKSLADPLDVLYLKAGIGTGYFRKFEGKGTGMLLNSERHNMLTLGAGYYVMDNIRVEMNYLHHVDPTMVRMGSAPVYNSKAVTEKHAAKINSFFVSGAIDVMDLSAVTIFLGAGLGIAQIKEKIGIYGVSVPYSSVSSRRKSNMAINFSLGASSEFAAGVHADLTIGWTSFGKSKSAYINSREVGKNHYRSLDSTITVRYDI